MALDIKICGLKTEEAVDAALDGGANHIGFIFFEKSPRHVEAEVARDLSVRARQRLAIPVAVTVDADDATLADIVATVKPGMLQLHGKESPTRVADVRAKFGLPVMKAFSIREAGDLDAIEPYYGIADRFLFDAKPPANSALPGGNGVSFDWSLLAALDGKVNYMLSGGLDPENVAEALAVSGARALDVSSGVESAPGVKDINRIAAFLKAAQAGETRNRE
ncbi:phosphoribosylanthranilate isomerase [Oricola indica]|jgi:phosphoribosylanthranilate isomerase|uniref:phosphoribosylanthranilate isomerase n=1 Tax=Oricola indica TaxID=2872591 RepID=UPI001CBAA24E|nr:phosphoribosylanthranilate isomerase [Oricola indica]